MAWNPHYKQSEIDPLAPVNGGMRWDGYRPDNLSPKERLAQLEAEIEADKNRPHAPPPKAEAASGHYITTTPPQEARAGEEYVYQANAFDPVASACTWYLENAPPGVTVDRYTGRITWTPEDGGQVEIILCARSMYGKVVQQSWSMCVRKATTIRPSRPNPRFRAALRRRAAVLRPRRLLWPAAKQRHCRDGPLQPAASPWMRPRATVPLRR